MSEPLTRPVLQLVVHLLKPLAQLLCPRLDVFQRVAADYPDVETESVLVDAVSAKFVTGAGILTRDVGGTASTEDVTKALIDSLNS